MMKNLSIILATAFLLVMVIRYIELRMLYYPCREMTLTPKIAGLDFEVINFTTSDHVRISGWFVPSGNSKLTILFCHGNAGNISHRIDKIKLLHELGCNVFIFDYRGYGNSQGRPSEQGLYRDVRGAYDYLLSRGLNNQEIVGYGESLGGAVMIDLASKNKLRGLVIDSSFTSIRDMVKLSFPYLPYQVLASRFDSISKIQLISAPKLFIHSLSDEIVPFSLARRLFSEANDPKALIEVRGGHNSCFYESRPVYSAKISDFFNQL